MAEEALHVHGERVGVLEVVRQHHRPCHDHHLEIEHAAGERRGQQGHARLPGRAEPSGRRTRRAPSRVRRGSHRGRGGGGGGGTTKRGRRDGVAGGRGGGRSGFRGASRLQRRRLPPDEPPLPSPPPARRKRRPPGRGVAREGGESRATGSGRSAQQETVLVAAAAGGAPRARPEEAASADRAAEAGHLCPSEGGRSGAGEAPRGGKKRKKKKRWRGGRGGSREGASRNSFLRQQLGCLRNPHNAWENGARTRLRSANPTEAQSAGCRAASFSPLSLGFLNPAQDTRQAVVSRHC